MGGRSARRAAAVLLAAALGLGALAGCGKTSAPQAAPSASPTVSAEDQACRDRWSDLAGEVRSRARVGVDVRLALAERWNSLEAGVDYYRQMARSSQCGDLLAARRTSLATLGALTTRALPYDAGQRTATALALRGVYARLPKGKKEPAPVKAAYVVLAKQTARASKDLLPAFTELGAADPTDAKAVKTAMADLVLLADTSDAYRACTAALGVVRAWNGSLITAPKKK